MHVTGVPHTDCAVRCHVQEASVLVTRLCGCANRHPLWLLYHLAPVRSHGEAGRRVDEVTLRVQTYFSALLIEHGLSVTGLRAPPVVSSQ